MKIWYQSYSRIGFDPKWKNYEDDLKSYIQKVARPDTKVDVHGVSKMATKMTNSDYIQYMHVSEVIDNAFQAEREGYDAFCLGGTLDLGAVYLREVLDIPVAFIAESSFYVACLLARKFSIIAVNGGMLRRQMELVKDNGLVDRCIPGVHMDTTMLELVDLFRKNPKSVADMFSESARKVIVQGAGALVPGFGALCSFFGEQGIRDVDSVPIIDAIAVVIKTAEMLVDLHRTGIKRSRKGIFDYPSKEELIAARKLYGIE
jgi:allantoin racemase